MKSKDCPDNIQQPNPDALIIIVEKRPGDTKHFVDKLIQEFTITLKEGSKISLGCFEQIDDFKNVSIYSMGLVSRMARENGIEFDLGETILKNFEANFQEDIIKGYLAYVYRKKCAI
jgi:hypothetical protein